MNPVERLLSHAVSTADGLICELANAGSREKIRGICQIVQILLRLPPDTVAGFHQLIKEKHPHAPPPSSEDN